MNDDITTSASAYLDDELNAAEREAAERDPVVMNEVARMRRLLVQMTAIEPSASNSEIDARIDAAFRAARAEAPAQAVAPAAPAAPTREREQSKRPERRPARVQRFLAVAAGVLGIGVLGAVVLNTINDDAQLDSAGSAATTQQSADATGDTMTSAGSDERMSANTEAASMATDDSAEMSADTSADAPSAPMTGPVGGADGQMAETTTAASEGDSASAESAVRADDGAGGDLIIDGVDALRDFTTFLLLDVPLAELPFPPLGDCIPRDADDRELFVIAGGTYNDPADGQLVPIWIAVRIDAENEPGQFTTYAIDQADCAVIVFTQGSLGG